MNPIGHCSASTLSAIGLIFPFAIFICGPWEYALLPLRPFFFFFLIPSGDPQFKNGSDWGHFRLLCGCFLNWFRELPLRDSNVRRLLLLREYLFGESYLTFRHEWLDCQCGKEKVAIASFWLTPWRNEAVGYWAVVSLQPPGGARDLEQGCSFIQAQPYPVWDVKAVCWQPMKCG